MTEEEWLTRHETHKLLNHVACNGASPRKTRLLMVAWCRMMGGQFADPQLREGVEVAERFADHSDAQEDASRLHGGDLEPFTLLKCLVWPHDLVLMYHAFQFDYLAGGSNIDPKPPDPTGHAEHVARVRQRTNLLRDLFGNPFRPVAFDPRWRTETALALATGIYDERAFDRLPILADALEEAGCDNANVLSHCREPGPHARGCWVVDGALGKV